MLLRAGSVILSLVLILTKPERCWEPASLRGRGARSPQPGSVASSFVFNRKVEVFAGKRAFLTAKLAAAPVALLPWPWAGCSRAKGPGEGRLGFWGTFHIPHPGRLLPSRSVKARASKAPNISSPTWPPCRHRGKSSVLRGEGNLRPLNPLHARPRSKSQQHPAGVHGQEPGARLVLNTALDPSGKKEKKKNHPGTHFPGFGQLLISSGSTNQKVPASTTPDPAKEEPSAWASASPARWSLATLTSLTSSEQRDALLAAFKGRLQTGSDPAQPDGIALSCQSAAGSRDFFEGDAALNALSEQICPGKGALPRLL